MAKKDELKSFQELILEERQKSGQKQQSPHDRKIEKAGPKSSKSQKKKEEEGLSLAFQIERASGALEKPAKEKKEKVSPRAAGTQSAKKQENPAAARQKKSLGKQERMQQQGIEKHHKKKNLQKQESGKLETRENISYLPAALEDPVERRRRSTRGAVLLLFIIASLGILGFLGYQFIRADEIAVRGNESFEDSYVIALSGIQSGTHIFNVDQRAAAAGIAQDPHLVLQKIEYTFPNKITLVVTERKDAACFEFLGTYVLTDSEGIILGHIQGEEKPENLPVIRGISVTEFALGAKIRTDDTYKQSIMTILLENMQSYQLTERIWEIDLQDTNSIIFQLSNGMKVNLGQADQMEEKMAWLHNILEELEAQGLSGGTIDLSSVEAPTYLPPTQPEASGDAAPQDSNPPA